MIIGGVHFPRNLGWFFICKRVFKCYFIPTDSMYGLSQHLGRKRVVGIAFEMRHQE